MTETFAKGYESRIQFPAECGFDLASAPGNLPKVYVRVLQKISRLAGIPAESMPVSSHLIRSPDKLRLDRILDPHTQDLQAFVNATPGLWTIYISRTCSKYLPWDEANMFSLRWIARWAESVLNSADYYQLDASFHALPPYVYTIPIGMIQTEAFPIELALGPTEKLEMFNSFTTDYEEISGERPSFYGKA
jgi:hypothetical protein